MAHARALALLRLAALLAAQASALLVLARVGEPVRVDWADPVAWLATTAPADAAVAATRLVGLAVGWWLVMTTVVYLLARVSGAARLAMVAGRVTLPALRRAVDRAAAAGVTATILLAGPGPPAAADPLPPPLSAPSARSEPESVVLPPQVGRPGALGGPQTGEHVVAPGEHLWGIAARAVGEPDERAVAAYWLRLIAANRDALRSGDPDLIYPGERLDLPERA